MFKKKIKLSPVMTFIILTFAVILISGFLHLLNVQAEYSTVSTVTNELVNNVVEVKSLLSTSGIRHIVSTTVSNFVNFSPLAMLIIVLIGVGVLERSGYTKTFFTLLTRNSKKYTITFSLILICLLISIVGEIGYVIMLPFGALLFKYGRRNPLGGIVASFASLSFGYGINIFLSSTDSSLLTITLNAAKSLDSGYSIGIFFGLFIMILMLIITSLVFTHITEKKIMPILPRIEIEEEEVKITNKELRGLIIGTAAGLLYVLIVAYMIIPGLPFSGALLDDGGLRYIDMLFGANSLFNKGFVFIITMLFVIVGLGYGLMAKTIKSNKDVTESLSYSIEEHGNVLVLIFFASLFLGVYEQSNIGQVIAAFISNIIGSLNFTGILLIVFVFIFIAVANIFLPSSLLKWNIMSGSVVPLMMNASISPELTQIIYVAAGSVTNGLTPLLAFIVIYIAFMEKYSKSESVSLFGCFKYMVPYAITITLIWLVVICAWYMIGVPIGIGAFPGVTYGA